MTVAELVAEIDQDIVRADREALLAAHAFTAGTFSDYWAAYHAKVKADLERANAELAGPPAAGGNGEASG